MSFETYWRQFGRCGRCGATEAQPCHDMRAPRPPLFPLVQTDRAHKGRALAVGVPDTPEAK